MNSPPNTNPPREEEIRSMIDELKQSSEYFENHAPESCKKAIVLIENLWGTIQILESALDKIENSEYPVVNNPHRRYRRRN